MNSNPWVAPKCRAIRRVLVALDEHLAEACELVPDAGCDPQIVILRHAELANLALHFDV